MNFTELKDSWPRLSNLNKSRLKKSQSNSRKKGDVFAFRCFNTC